MLRVKRRIDHPAQLRKPFVRLRIVFGVENQPRKFPRRLRNRAVRFVGVIHQTPQLTVDMRPVFALVTKLPITRISVVEMLLRALRALRHRVRTFSGLFRAAASHANLLKR